MCKKAIGLMVIGLLGWASLAPAADLVAHWKLDEESGTTASDSSGKGTTAR